MNDATPRRRRSEGDSGGSGGGGGIPLFPLIIAVVFVGFLLGGILSRMHGGGKNAVAVPTSMPPITPVPVASAPPLAKFKTLRKPKPSARPSGSPSPIASASPRASLAPSVKPIPVPTAQPSVIFITPSPAAKIAVPNSTPKPPAPRAVTPKPAVATPTPASPERATGTSGAESIVRSYLAAIARGDQSTATSYLSHGTPSETFMKPDTRINDISGTPNSNGSYRVTADVSDSNNQEYFITFNVQPGPYGMQITDHYTIKPH